MCAQLVVYPQRRPIFSTTLPGWLPVPYYTQHKGQPYPERGYFRAYIHSNSATGSKNRGTH